MYSIPHDCGEVCIVQTRKRQNIASTGTVKVIIAKLQANNMNRRLNLVTDNLMPVSTRRIMYG